MQHLETGLGWKFDDNISTDLICPGRLSHLRSNLPELAKHVLVDADPNFPQIVKEIDYIIAGDNFGTGSSREHAAEVIKLSGIKAVIAKSFARIFYRNATNIGLLLIEADTTNLKSKDRIVVDLPKSELLINETFVLPCKGPNGYLRTILNDGGLIPHIKKNQGYIIT